MRTRTVWLWLAVLLICIGGGAYAAANHQPDMRPDVRLDQPVSISVAYDSLDELCAKLHEMSEVTITVDPTIKEYKVVVRVREQPLRNVMRQVAVLFDFRWLQGPGKRPRYQLAQSAARAELGPALRKRFMREREARYRKVFKDAIHALRARPEELRELARSDPEAVAIAAQFGALGGGYRALVFAALDDEAVEAVLDGEVVRLRFGQLPAETQRAIKDRTLRRLGGVGRQEGPPPSEMDYPWEAGEVTYRRTDEGRPPWRVEAELHVQTVNPAVAPIRDPTRLASLTTAAYWGAWAGALMEGDQRPDAESSEWYRALHSLERQYDIDIYREGREEAMAVIPSWAQPAEHTPAPASSGKSVSLKQSSGHPLAYLPELLLAVGEQLDVNLVADCYWTASVGRPTLFDHADMADPRYPPRAAGGGPRSVDANPDYSLDRICRDRGYGWLKEGEFFRVRDPLWFVDDPEEVPASVLNEWMRRTDGEKRAAPDDYAFLVTNLSVRLARNLPGTHYKDGRPVQLAGDVSWDGAYYAMKVYALLPPAVRDRAAAGGVAVPDELPDSALAAWQALRKATAPQLAGAGGEPWPNRLRLQTRQTREAVPSDDVGGRKGVFDHKFDIELWPLQGPHNGSGASVGRCLGRWSYRLYRTDESKSDK